MTTPLKELAAWKALESHAETMRKAKMSQLFAEDPKRGERLNAEAEGVFLDYSKHLVTDETLKLFVDLANESGVKARIDAMFKGEKINITEGRAVLHLALRAPKDESIIVDGVDVVPEVHKVLDKMAEFAESIRSGKWLGYTGKPIRNVVNIGIGGSDLGPVMAYEALRHYSDRDLVFRFVSNIDGSDFFEATRDLDPEETLFIISSKTFTTLETMTNAHSARVWSLAKLKEHAAVARHFVAVSTNAAEVSKFGIDTANMFGFWDWGWRALLDGFGNRSLHHDRHRPHALHRDAKRVPMPWTSTSAPRRLKRISPFSWACSPSGTTTFSMRRQSLYYRTTSTSSASLPTCSSSRWSQTASMSRSMAASSITRPGQSTGASPAPTGSTRSNQLIHQGTKLIPCDFIGFCKSLKPRSDGIMIC